MIATASAIVEREVSRSKLRREVDQWKSTAQARDRGWVLLRYDEDELEVEIGFLSRVSLSTGAHPLAAMVCAIRLKYDNYDLWPPSLTFIDPFSGSPTRPHVRAVNVMEGKPRDVLVDAHPETSFPFLCVPGIREYHSHPQHTGDDWLLHRALGLGTVSTICDRVWRFMARNVVGLNVQLQATREHPVRAQLVIALAQGEVAYQPMPAGEAPQNDSSILSVD